MRRQQNCKYSRKGNEIEVLLLGTELTPLQIDSLQKKMANYKLANTKLLIRQGLNAKNDLDLSRIKASILEAVYQNNTADKKSNPTYNTLDTPTHEIKEEIRSLYPQLRSYSISNVEVHQIDTNLKDTMTMVVASFKKPLPVPERNRLQLWLKKRLNVDSLRLIVAN